MRGGRLVDRGTNKLDEPVVRKGAGCALVIILAVTFAWVVSWIIGRGL